MQQSPDGGFYRHLIRDAWKTVRENPVLWVFGFFASLLGNGGVYELLVQGTGRLGLQEDFGGFLALAGIIPSGSEVWRAATGAGLGLVTPLALIALLLVLAATLVWAVVASQGAIITGIRDAARGRKPKFTGLLGAGAERAMPLLALNAVSRAAIAAFFYLLLSFLLLLISQPSAGAALGYLLAFLVLVPLTVVIGFMTVYAAGYLVLYRARLVESMESAVMLFLKNWLVSLETAALLFAINVVVSVAVGLAVYLLGAVALVTFGFVSAASGALPWVLLLFGAVAAVGVLALAGAGLAAFQYAVWVELFLKLNTPGHGAVSKLVRWSRRLFGR